MLWSHPHLYHQRMKREPKCPFLYDCVQQTLTLPGGLWGQKENRDYSHLLPRHRGQGNNMRRLDSICTPKDQGALHLPAGEEGSEEVQCMVKTPTIIKQIWPRHGANGDQVANGDANDPAQEEWGSPSYNGDLVGCLNFYFHQHCPQPFVDRGVSMKASLQRKFK